MISSRMLTTERECSYMSSAFRIVDPNYIPTFQDILWANKKSMGLQETQYVLNDTLCRFFDLGGTRAERREWLRRCRADVKSIIFTLDVSCYDQVLTDDATQNRMTEQLEVWKSVVDQPKFVATDFIVLFTKLDKLTPSKLEASPFNSIFPDYAGKPDSTDDILQYLAFRLDTASKEWTRRRLVFCNAGSIWNSPTNMAEVAVSALNEVEAFR